MHKRDFQHKWVIRNWGDLSRYFVQPKTAECHVHLEHDNVDYAKLLVKVLFKWENEFEFNWTLLSKHDCLVKPEANFVAEILRMDGTTVRYEVQANPLVEETCKVTKPISASSSGDWSNADGFLEISLKTTLNAINSLEIMKFKTTFQDELGLNLASLLEDKKNSDVTICTKDKAELFAHKIILEARCPVFASMFGSGYLESSTGHVNVDDISAKTMKILLNYWYTGTLLKTWMDNDTVVEFTYTAGKYQVDPVLHMLDDLLGRDPNVTELDIELLKITNQLSLIKAEDRLLKRIVNKLSKAKNAAEVLGFFSIPIEKFDEKNFTASQIFEAWNEVMRGNDDEAANYQDIKLMSLAGSFGMKNVEAKLLKRVVDTLNKLINADELFALFKLQK